MSKVTLRESRLVVLWFTNEKVEAQVEQVHTAKKG